MNNPRRCLSLAFMLIVASGLALSAAAQTASASNARIVGPINDAVQVTLAGNTRPEATPANDLGQVDDGLALGHMQLLLNRSPEHQAALDAYAASLADKSSPNFHQWLTAQQIGANYGVAQADIDQVTGWLSAHGFAVNGVYPNRVLIDFSGTAAQVREAFSTEIHNYQVKGARHIANASDPKIPAALAPVVVGIVSLNDFKPRPMHQAKPNYTFTSGGSTYYAVTPADLATIYNLNPAFAAGYTGKGQTIVVIEDTNVYSTNDWTVFRKTFGLSKYTSGSFTQVHPGASWPGNCADPGVNGDDVEAIIDAEYASASAPNAAIVLASCADTNTTFGGLIALQNLLIQPDPPPLVSISYGECEAENGAAANFSYRITYEIAALEGVSVFVSSGDEGAASCDANQSAAVHGIGVSGLASTAYNVAVGGTDFGDSYLNENSTYWNATNTATYGSAISYMPEIPWNDSCAGTLLANYVTGSPISYGPSGFCNTAFGEEFLTTGSGSGGPSGCAYGNPSISGVVSGSCAGYAKPYWQSLVGVPNDHVRDIPDVSLFAANGLWGHYYPICYSDPSGGGVPCTGAPDTWPGYGGTSFASPIMAGIQALVNQKHGRQGNPNPTYYAIANAEYGWNGSAACNSSNGNTVGSGCVFHDVTLGDMDVNCTATQIQSGKKTVTAAFNCYLDGATNGVLSTSNHSYKPAYAAGTGWDFATGIGTVNAYNLVLSPWWW
jgi:subtilase family serine protease